MLPLAASAPPSHLVLSLRFSSAVGGSGGPYLLTVVSTAAMCSWARLSPGSAPWDMVQGGFSWPASRGLALGENQTSLHPRPPAVATPLAQAFSVVTTGAASGRPLSARGVSASCGRRAKHDVFIGASLPLAQGFHFSWAGMGEVVHAWCQTPGFVHGLTL